MTERQPRPLLVVALCAAAALVSGCDIAIGGFSEQEREHWSKSYELPPGGRLELRNVNGLIDVQPAEGRTLEVSAEKTARANSVEAAKEALGRIRIDETASGDAVRIETRVEGSGMFTHSGVSVRYSVRVPAGVEVDLQTTNGGIEAAGVSARTRLRATNGGIRARDISGALEARTTNGGLDIDLARVADGGVRLECTNGGIELRLPSDARAAIDARITNGGISTGALRLETIESSRRRLEATMNGGGPRIDISCTNGGLSMSGR